MCIIDLIFSQNIEIIFEEDKKFYHKKRNLMTNPVHKKQYKKYTKILPQQRKFLQQRQRE